MLTFDEFLAIPPCTTGKHSTVDDSPAPEVKPEIKEEDVPPPPKPITTTAINASLLAPVAAAQPPKSPAPAPDVTEESDPEDTVVPTSATCKRRGCGQSYDEDVKREDEECVHHPGLALFHEGSKGWTCCKRR